MSLLSIEYHPERNVSYTYEHLILSRTDGVTLLHFYFVLLLFCYVVAVVAIVVSTIFNGIDSTLYQIRDRIMNVTCLYVVCARNCSCSRVQAYPVQMSATKKKNATMRARSFVRSLLLACV